MGATNAAVRFTLRCTACGRDVAADNPQPRCPCSGTGTIAVDPDLEAAAKTLRPESLAERPGTLMRYRELLPFLSAEPEMSPLMTPLVPVPELARELDLASLVVKDESCQPSGSLKARPSAVAVTRATALGFNEVACASSGNAAISLAAMARAQGLKATAFVSDRIPRAKLAQLQAYGPRVVVVAAPYEAAYALCEEACARWGWYNRNCAQDPFLVEGKKTCGLEIAEQTSDSPPDWVCVPIGDGCTVTGIRKGLAEMAVVGISPTAPRMLGVQAAGACAIHDAWAENRGLAEVEARYPAAATRADSIAVTHPHNGERALDAIRTSDGAIVVVNDDEMDAAMLELALCGVLVEPASAATLAGLRKAVAKGIVEPGSRAVAVGTGSGLKNLDLVAELQAEPAAAIEPTLEALEHLVD